MRLSMIAAMATNGVIGRDNGLPWHIGTDLKRLKQLTMGHHMIMGRKTYDSIGRPLPGRVFIVITGNPEFKAEGVQVTHSLEDAIRIASEAGDQEPFIAGGAIVFEQAIHRADRMYLTRVHADVEGDTFFPEFDDVTEWKLTDSEHFEAGEKDDHPFSFLTYDRASAAGHAIPEEG